MELASSVHLAGSACTQNGAVLCALGAGGTHLEPCPSLVSSGQFETRCAKPLFSMALRNILSALLRCAVAAVDSVRCGFLDVTLAPPRTNQSDHGYGQSVTTETLQGYAHASMASRMRGRYVPRCEGAVCNQYSLHVTPNRQAY